MCETVEKSFLMLSMFGFWWNQVLSCYPLRNAKITDSLIHSTVTYSPDEQGAQVGRVRGPCKYLDFPRQACPLLVGILWQSTELILGFGLFKRHHPNWSQISAPQLRQLVFSFKFHFQQPSRTADRREKETHSHTRLHQVSPLSP